MDGIAIGYMYSYLIMVWPVNKQTCSAFSISSDIYFQVHHLHSNQCSDLIVLVNYPGTTHQQAHMQAWPVNKQTCSAFSISSDIYFQVHHLHSNQCSDLIVLVNYPGTTHQQAHSVPLQGQQQVQIDEKRYITGRRGKGGEER